MWQKSSRFGKDLMFVEMMLLGFFSGFLSYVVARLSFELWRMGMPVYQG